jgi:hypothetical protein
MDAVLRLGSVGALGPARVHIASGGGEQAMLVCASGTSVRAFSRGAALQPVDLRDCWPRSPPECVAAVAVVHGEESGIILACTDGRVCSLALDMCVLEFVPFIVDFR